MYLKGNKDLGVLALYLGDYVREYYLREISKRAMLPLKTTQRVLAALEKNSIIKSSVKGKNKYFRLNLENIQTKICLLQAELHRTSLFLSKYPAFKTFLKDIKTNSPVIVFGSFARFAAGKDSDMDMLIISEQDKLPLHLLPYKVHEIKLTDASFLKAVRKRETLIKEIEENHVILNNHSFYINVMWELWREN